MIALDGRVAVVTSAASYHGDDDPYRAGQGGATSSSTLARLGAAVDLADINGALAEERAAAIQPKGGVQERVRLDTIRARRDSTWYIPAPPPSVSAVHCQPASNQSRTCRATGVWTPLMTLRTAAMSPGNRHLLRDRIPAWVPRSSRSAWQRGSDVKPERCP